MYIIQEVESKSKRKGGKDKKSSRTSKNKVKPSGDGGGAGPQTVDGPSGKPGEFDNYAHLRTTTRDSAATPDAAAAAANVTEDGGVSRGSRYTTAYEVSSCSAFGNNGSVFRSSAIILRLSTTTTDCYKPCRLVDVMNNKAYDALLSVS